MDVHEVSLPGSMKSVVLQAWSDNTHPHYVLNGEKFNDNQVILDLLLHSKGACVIDPEARASNDIHCDYNCTACKNSVYYIVEQKRAQYMVQCREACSRHPKAGDEWEISFVMRKPRVPTYENFHFEAKAYVPDMTIIEIIYEALTGIDPTFFDDAQYQYVKILRFDMAKPLDVSSVANEIIRDLKARGQ